MPVCPQREIYSVWYTHIFGPIRGGRNAKLNWWRGKGGVEREREGRVRVIVIDDATKKRCERMKRFYRPEIEMESGECAGTFDATLHPSRYGIFAERLFLIDAIQTSQPAGRLVAARKTFRRLSYHLNSKFSLGCLLPQPLPLFLFPLLFFSSLFFLF